MSTTILPVIELTLAEFLSLDKSAYAMGQFFFKKSAEITPTGYYRLNLNRLELRNKWPTDTTTQYGLESDKTQITGDGVEVATVMVTFPAWEGDRTVEVVVNGLAVPVGADELYPDLLIGQGVLLLISDAPGTQIALSVGDVALAIEVI